jgi:hypothetical protein
VPHANLNYYRPTQMAAKLIVNEWRREHPTETLGWSSGYWGENAMVGFYADHHVKALPNLPDSPEALISPLRNWQNQAGILVCPLGPESHPQDQSQQCMDSVQQWLENQKQSTTPRTYALARDGWRYPRPIAFRYAVYHYQPPHP